jgi:hypothetical protein
MKLIKKDVDKIIAPYVNHKGFLCGRIFLEWSKIVSPEIAKIAEPYRTTVKPKGLATLVLNTKSASAFLLSSLEEEILEQINGYFKTKVIHKIQYKHTLFKSKEIETPSPIIDIKSLQALGDVVEQIQDDTLRQTLKRIGMSILMKKEN